MTEVEAQHVGEHSENPILAVDEGIDCEVILEVHWLGVFPPACGAEEKSSSDRKLTVFLATFYVVSRVEEDEDELIQASWYGVASLLSRGEECI